MDLNFNVLDIALHFKFFCNPKQLTLFVQIVQLIMLSPEIIYV
jgi:hypothetical protein